MRCRHHQGPREGTLRLMCDRDHVVARRWGCSPQRGQEASSGSRPCTNTFSALRAWCVPAVRLLSVGMGVGSRMGIRASRLAQQVPALQQRQAVDHGPVRVGQYAWASARGSPARKLLSCWPAATTVCRSLNRSAATAHRRGALWPGLPHRTHGPVAGDADAQTVHRPGRGPSGAWSAV